MITPQRGRFRISLNLLCEMLNVVRRENQNNNIVTSGGRFNHSRATNCRELNIFCGGGGRKHVGEILTVPVNVETYVQVESTLCASQISCLNLCLLSYKITPWSRVLLEKLTLCQLVNNLPTFYWAQIFITAFTSAHQLSLTWASSVQSISHIAIPEDPS